MEVLEPLKERSLTLLEFEQCTFGRQTAAESRERAIRADHAMTGHDDRDRVGAVGQTDGPNSFRILDAFGELQIANRFAIRDATSIPATLVLKRRAVEGERCRKFFSRPAKY